jgi:hypothetical protein
MRLRTNKTDKNQKKTRKKKAINETYLVTRKINPLIALNRSSTKRKARSGQNGSELLWLGWGLQEGLYGGSVAVVLDGWMVGWGVDIDPVCQIQSFFPPLHPHPHSFSLSNCYGGITFAR